MLFNILIVDETCAGQFKTRWWFAPNENKVYTLENRVYDSFELRWHDKR